MSSQRSQKETRHYVSPPDEQRHVPSGVAAPLIARTTAGRVASSEAAKRLASLPRRGAFLPRAIAAHARFVDHDRRRKVWLRARRSEIVQLTGAVSYGVGAMLAAAAWLYAGGECAAELAAENLDVELFKVAATLTATARTHDFGAYEMAVREAEARKKASPKAWDFLGSDDEETDK